MKTYQAPPGAEGTAAPGAAPAGRPGGGNSRPWAGLAILLLLLLIGVIAAFGWWYRAAQAADGPGRPDANARVGTLADPAERQAELDRMAEEGMLTFGINATPSFESGSAKGNLMIENPPENGNRFTVAIYRRDTEEQIYQSGYLDPGQVIETAPLDTELAEGEYPCVAYFDAYSLGDDSYLGRAGAEITLYVLE